MVLPDSRRISRVLRYSGTTPENIHFRVQDCHLLWLDFPDHSASGSLCNSHVRGPTTPRRKTFAVWAVPRSLAATQGIDFSFYSSGYLDVSVHQVRRNVPMDSARTYSGIPGSTLVCQLPQAYRRLPRPSSSFDAKTSPMHP